MKILISSLTTLFCLYSLIAQADWRAQFQAPEKQDAHLRIDLPEDLDAFTLATLGFELDGIDITAMMNLDGNSFVYQPLQPLAAGEHQVRLISMDENGNFSERQQWRFSIQNSAGQAEQLSPSAITQAETALTSSRFRANTLTELSYRAADRNLNSPPGKTILSGSGDLSGEYKRNNWTVSARSNYLLQSEKALRVTGNALDIGEYALKSAHTGDKLNSQVTLGHHSTGLENLLISNFYRRGLSAGFQHANGLNAQAFAFNTAPQTGADNFTGLSRDRENLYGSAVSFTPFGKGIDALKLSAAYYTGERTEEGTGIGELNPSATGDGWGFGIAKSYAQGRTRLSADFAQTDFDSDSTGAAPEDSGNALAFKLAHRLYEQPLIINDQALNIDLGLAYERIDTFYYSLANSNLAADRDAYTASAALYWGSLSANLVLLEETNNVDDLQSLPTDKLRSAELGLNYSFNQQTDGLAWLGTPYLFFTALSADLSRDKTPSAYLGNQTDSESQAITFGGGSNYEDWYWSASHTYSQFDDNTNLNSDTRSNQTTLNAGWNLSDNVSLSSGLQYSAFEDRDLNQASHTTNLIFGMVASPIPKKLDLNFDYNLNLSGGNNDTENSHAANGEIEWTFIRPRTNRSGLSLALRFSLEDAYGNSNSALNNTDYQAFLVLRVKAPFASQNL